MSDDNNDAYMPGSGKLEPQDFVDAFNFARSFINAAKCDSKLFRDNLGFKEGDYKRKVNINDVGVRVPLTKLSSFIEMAKKWKLGDESYYTDLSATLNNWQTQNLNWEDILGSECVVQSKDFCDNISKYPYDGCKLDQKKGENPYLEWQNTAGRCEINQNCMSNSECIGNKCTCEPGVIDCPGNSECIGGFCETSPDKPVKERPGRCIFGNMALRNWCENPVCRCQSSDTDCQNKLKDLSPFHYEESLGECFISKPFCRNLANQYLTGLPCNPKNPNDNASTYSKCVGDGVYMVNIGPETKQYCGWNPNRPKYTKNSQNWRGDANGSCMHIPHEGPYNDHVCVESNVLGEIQHVCVGPGSQCYSSLGKNIAKFLVGNFLFARLDTLNRGEDLPACFKGGTFDPDSSNESFQMPPASVKPDFIKGVHDKMKKVPKKQTVFVDPKYVKNKKLIMPNFVRDKKTQEGINLYLIKWKKNPYTKNIEIGFDYEEIKQRLPRIIKEINGKKFIVLDKKDENKEVRKIANTYGLKEYLTKMMQKIIII